MIKGKHLAKLRAKLHITLDELASATFVNREILESVEEGRRVLGIEDLLNLLNYLNIKCKEKFGKDITQILKSNKYE